MLLIILNPKTFSNDVKLNNRGAQACILAFSCTDWDSFKSVSKWKQKVEEECGNIPMALVMTKMDLFYQASIDR